MVLYQRLGWWWCFVDDSVPAGWVMVVVYRWFCTSQLVGWWCNVFGPVPAGWVGGGGM
jgi:hypothetical protein